ncbi:MAG: class I SAM-dependent methyltransferase [Armatimonadetes bacterium]|nr:class I SAM-dependent methyltransferase [Akkermansiaceae bacterium]
MNYKEIFDERGNLYNKAHQIAPGARKAEGEAMLKWLQPRADETIIVTAAGGGFDACLIAEFLLPACARIICVEPSPLFSSLIPGSFEIINAPLGEIPLPDGVADAVLNLAALHHVNERQNTFEEWTRLLRSGGRIVLGDVEEGSSNAAYLNNTVDQFTPGGHDGKFIKPGELTEAFSSLPYENPEEALEAYEWIFRDHMTMVSFSKNLFGMVNGTDEQIAAGIQQYLGVQDSVADNAMFYPWSLRFFRATKR